MKTPLLFTPVFLAILLIYACDLPETIEIRGSPSVHFAANYNFGEMFSDIIASGFGDTDNHDLKILQCENTDFETFIFYINLLTNADDVGDAVGNAIENAFYQHFEIDDTKLPLGLTSAMLDSKTPSEIIDFLKTVPGVSPDEVLYATIDHDIPLVDSNKVTSGANFDIDFGGNMSDFLPGFEFEEVKAKLYIDGSGMSEHLLIEFTIGEEMETLDGSDFGESGYNSDWVNFTSLPDHGVEFDLKDVINDMVVRGVNNLDFKYQVYLKEGRYPISLLTSEHSVKVELVLWLPLKFISPGGTELNFSDDFGFGAEDKDFFGRESVGGGDSLTDIFESISVKIGMNKSPFTGATFIVKSAAANPGNPSIEIKTDLGGKSSLDFALDAATMTKINSPDYFPFVPKFIIKFDPGGTLGIPRNFMATTVSFDAKMKYTYDLTGN